MSSILKALKKAEEGRPEARDTESWSHRFDSGEAIRRQARRSWWLRASAVVVCLVFFVGAGGWLLYGYRHQLKESAHRLAKKTSKPEPPGRPAASVRPETDSTQVQRPSSGPQSPPPYPEAAAAVTEPLPPAKTESPRTESPREVVTSIRESVPSGQPAAPVSIAVTKGSPGTLDTGRFRLEAIVWSDNPESRFAVINGNIVRVGGSVGNASVTAIERDRVEVSSGDKTGELRFTHD